MARQPQQRRAQPDDRPPPLEGELVEATERAATSALVRASDFADIDAGIVAAIAGAHIDNPAEHARRYPRQAQAAADAITELATWNQETARECMYALPRGRDAETGRPKAITGESVRFFEIVAQCWGNCHADAFPTTVNRRDKYVEAKGVFTDLQTNYTVEATVRRRISGKSGEIFNADMIIVTAQAAVSIALRNAIKRGVPRPVWKSASDKVQAVIRGDAKTLGARRVELLTKFRDELDVKPAELFRLLGVKGEMDIGLDELVVAAGFYTALRNNEVTVEDLLRDAGAVDPGARGLGHAFDGASDPVGTPQAAAPAAAGQADADEDAAFLARPAGPATAATAATFREPPIEATMEQVGAAVRQEEEAATDDETVEPGPAPSDTAYWLAGDEPNDDEAWPVYVNGELVEYADSDLGQERGLLIYEQHAPKPAPHPAPPPTRGRRAAPPAPAEDEQRGAETPSPSPASSDASRAPDAPGPIEAALAAFKSKVEGAESWLQIKAALNTLRRVPEYAALPDEVQAADRVSAYTHGLALSSAGRDPVNVTNDAYFFTLWLDTGPTADDVDLAFSQLIRSPHWREQKDAVKDGVSAAMRRAKGEAV